MDQAHGRYVDVRSDYGFLLPTAGAVADGGFRPWRSAGCAPTSWSPGIHSGSDADCTACSWRAAARDAGRRRSPACRFGPARRACSYRCLSAARERVFAGSRAAPSKIRGEDSSILSDTAHTIRPHPHTLRATIISCTSRINRQTGWAASAALAGQSSAALAVPLASSASPACRHHRHHPRPC